MTTYMDPFDHFLDHTLRNRAAAQQPAGLEQRLLAHIANAAPTPAGANNLGLFSTTDRVNTRRSSTSLWSAIAAHAAVFLIIFTLAAQHIHFTEPVKGTMLTEIPPPLPPIANKIAGGGGQPDHSAATQGHLPKVSDQQLLPPKAPPLEQARLAVEPTVVVQKDLQMADNKMPDLGVPNSSLKGFSMGNGHGTGIGSGDGAGIGAGSGGNIGGGPMHIGGSVQPPSILYKIDPEFSEEARKAKFSGDVQIYLWVDEHGNPSHVQVVRGVGMGLDERAVEAVRQYKFKPATQNGKPVKVDLYVNVNFTIM